MFAINSPALDLFFFFLIMGYAAHLVCINGGIPAMKKNSCKSSIKGFTLIELLVVVLIIGILAAIALPQYQKAVERARTADALAHINAIEKAIELVVLQNGGIPEGNLVGKYQLQEKFLPSDIELTKGLTCDNSTEYGDKFCYNNDWRYLSYCKGNVCRFSASRGKKQTDGFFLLSLIEGRFDGKSWYKRCAWEDDRKGEEICMQLNSSLNFDDIEEGF